MSRRVLFVSFHFAELATTIAKAIPRNEVLLLLNEQNAARELPSDVPASGIKLKIAGLKNPLRFMLAVVRYIYICLYWRPGIVHFQEVPSDFSYVCWKLSSRYKRVLTIHDVETHPGRDSTIPSRNLIARDRMRATADHVIVHGESLKKMAIAKFGVDPRRVSVVPHVAMRQAILRKTTDGDDLAVLFFGRMERYKGLDVLLHALELSDISERITVRIAGEGTELDRLRPRLKLHKNVEILDGRIEPDAVTTLMGEADVVVLPYTEASQSGVVAMAFGLGRPVVASRIGAIPEIVTPGVNGLLVEPNDPQALMDALLVLAKDRALLASLSTGAADTAAGKISPARVGAATADIYDLVARH